MALQLSLLTGSPLLGKQPSPADLDLALELNLPHCQAEAQRVGPVENGADLYWRMAFAILSVHSNFHATCGAWQELRGLGDVVDPHYPVTVIPTLRRWNRIQYPVQKGKFLSLLWDAMFRDGECFWPQGLEDVEYRDYVRKGVKGLAWAKSSFATMLVKGEADVACVDTHMYRLFTGSPARGQIKGPEYLELESRVRVLAQRHGVSTSVAQHGLWDAMRGAHSPLLPDEGTACSSA